MLRRIILSLFLVSLVGGMAGCTDTWHGLRQDTSENLHTVGNAAHK